MSKHADHLLHHVRTFIREPYAWPGGYPKILLLRDGELLCAKCAGKNYRLIAEATRRPGSSACWEPVGIDLFMEGPSANCGNCNDEIESAYGVDEEGEIAE